MKNRFTTVDIVAALAELQTLRGMRLNNVYDIDNKTYLLRLTSKDSKVILLIESATRFHLTEYEWPKHNAPSGFTMKLRKHLSNRRLEEARQLGSDRVIDLQFGSGEAAYHVIVELYDRGNIALTDYCYEILNVLRPRTDQQDTRIAVRELYPVESAKQFEPVTEEKLRQWLSEGKTNDGLRKLLNPHLPFGPALIDHALLDAGFPDNVKLENGFLVSSDIAKLLSALDNAQKILDSLQVEASKGVIIQKREKRAAVPESGNNSDYLVYDEFHPFLFLQHRNRPFVEFPSYNKAIDEFFSKQESQKIDLKAIQQEKDAMKKLANVKKDHETRLSELQRVQEDDAKKGQYIEMNLEIVDHAIKTIQSAVANQLDWAEIEALVTKAKEQGDPIAKIIKGLKLNINQVTLLLKDPYEEENQTPLAIDVDLDLTAFANAKRYYDMKRTAAKKEVKTIEASSKAYKSAERKTKQALKEVATIVGINKARKVHWYEKFYWFISSENYLVIAGCDQQQNEMVVKRYLRKNDLYVHADLHGASSVIIKNPTEGAVPPKTLEEAGVMAVCYSTAWDAKIVTSAWWVYSHQVSKTAPTGEYLTTGSFMIRGKKNYLPPCHLIMGFSFLFKLDQESFPNHVGERRVRGVEDAESEVGSEVSAPVDLELEISEGESGNEDVAKETQCEDEENEDAKLEETADSKLETVEVDASNTEQSDDSEATEDVKDEVTSAFPDTEIRLEHVAGEQYHIKVRESSLSESTEPDATSKSTKPRPLRLKANEKTKTVPPPQPVIENKEKSLTKRQKQKQKKIKEKYGDQDEEDRQKAMEFFQSAGKPKPVKSTKKEEKKQGQKKTKAIVPAPQIISIDEEDAGASQKHQTDANLSEDEENDQEESKTGEDDRILQSLTGCPVTEDVLLFAMPVCAPYTAITNYKFKVKVTPGTGKRGKAAKTALNVFLHDRTATPREKDLLKGVKDQDISRNLPGKVKLSAPQLTKLKNKV